MAKKNLKTVHVKRQASSNQLDSAHAALVSQYANASQSAVNATLQDYAARFDLANSDAFHHSTVVGNSSNGSSTGSSALHGSSLPIAAAASGKNSKNIISIGNGHGSSAVGGSAGSGSIPRVSPISVIGSIIGSSALGGQPSSVASSTGSVLSHSSLGSSSLSALDLDNSAVSAMAGILKSSSNSAAFPRSVSTSVSPLPAASSAMAPAPVAAAAELASTATPSASASASIAVTSATSTAAAAASLSSTMRTMDDKLSLFPDIFDSSMRASFLGSYGLLNQETASPFQPSLPIDVPADYADLLDPLPSSVPSSSLFGTSASSAFNAERGGFNSFLYNSDSLLSGRFSNLSLAPGSSSLSGSGTYGNSSGGMSSGMGMGSMGMGYGNHGSGSGMGNMESSSMNIAGGGNSSHMNGMGGMGMGMGGMGNVGMNGMGNMGMSPHGDRMGGPNGNMMGGMHGASTATSQSQYLYSSSFPGTLSSTTGMVPFFSGMDQNPPCNTLYVGNLPHETMEEELRQIFSVQPGFKRLCFRMRSNGPMCFVEFDSIEYATAALFQLYGTHLSISTKGGIRLSYSKNPLGVRQHRPVTTFPAAQAAAVAAAAGLTYMPQPAAMSGMAGSLASAYGVSLPSAMSGMPGMTSMSGQVSLGDKDYRQVH
ncbi:hypothetical protein BC831DRAFT_450957 [Entophlyctis helioformis]|nr:hypothetical protein BC831DRAFT_450957 [Entophlyctis helioformis]